MLNIFIQKEEEKKNFEKIESGGNVQENLQKGRKKDVHRIKTYCVFIIYFQSDFSSFPDYFYFVGRKTQSQRVFFDDNIINIIIILLNEILFPFSPHII